MKVGKSKRQWRDENAKRFHDMDKWIKNCKPIKAHSKFDKDKKKDSKDDKQ